MRTHYAVKPFEGYPGSVDVYKFRNRIARDEWLAENQHYGAYAITRDTARGVALERSLANAVASRRGP